MEQLPLEDIERFSRQLLLSSWSEQKQLALAKAVVALPYMLPTAAMYLAGAGVRNLVLVDAPDNDAGLTKKLSRLDPAVKVVAQPEVPEVCSALITEDPARLKEASSDCVVAIVEERGVALYRAGTRLQEARTPAASPEQASLVNGTVAAGLILHGLLLNCPNA